MNNNNYPTMQLTSVLEDIFARATLEPSKSYTPELTLQVITDSKTMTDMQGKVSRRFLATDGKHACLLVYYNTDGEPNAIGDVIKIPKYAVSFGVRRNGQPRGTLHVYELAKVGWNPRPSENPPEVPLVNNAHNNSTKQPAPSAPTAPTAAPAFKPTSPSEKKNTSSAHASHLIPIEGLTPFITTWKIRARVSQKSDIRSYKNSRNEGQLFNVTFVDETGEIRATGFNKQVEQFYERLHEGEVYYVSKARVVSANKKFSNVQNDFELMFGQETEIVPCADEVKIPLMKYDFVPLGDLPKMEPQTSCDIIGVIKEVREHSQITSKNTGRPYDKREILIVDRSGVVVRLTLWGDQAVYFDKMPGAVIALKGVQVSDFDGRSLSALRSTTVTFDPDIREAHALKGWYDAQGHEETFETIKVESKPDDRSQIIPISEVISRRIGHSDQTEYFNIKAIILQVYSRSSTYPACPTCNKKVLQDTDGTWRCDRCDLSMEKPLYRYTLNMTVNDASDLGDGLRLSVFDEVGKIILGRDAAEIAEADPVDIEKILGSLRGCEYVFRCKTRKEFYKEEETVRYQSLSAISTLSKPLNYLEADLEAIETCY